jgi:endonuclease/exonuclease/phosphatase family metal-dependent hydrolase
MRIVTYNVRRCLGLDGVCSPERIAEVVASCRADVVALQELDVRRARSGHVDQAEIIARELGAGDLFFHPAFRLIEEEYGDAVITTGSARLVKAGPLPSVWTPFAAEPRGALWVSAQIGDKQIEVINTHLGLSRRERRAQASALLGPEWLGHPGCSGNVVLAGDLNSLPGGRVHRALAARLRDAHAGYAPRATFPSRFPTVRIDHLFVGTDIEVLSAGVVRTELARIASDHLPLVAELKLAG